MGEEMIEQKADVFVSVVVLVDEGIPDVADRVERLAFDVARRYRNYELVIVDNQLPQGVLVQLRELLRHTACIRVLRLSRRSSADTAVFAGLDAAIGDYVVVSALAYDSPEAVLDVVALLREGHDVVQGEHRGPLGGSVLTRAGRRAFYAYNRHFVRLDIPSRSTYLTGLTRSAVNAVSAASRTHRYLRHLVRYVGYRVHDYRYTMRDVQMARSRNRPRWLDAVEMISSYSTQPLRAVTVLGLAAGILSLLYGLYVVIVTLTSHHVAAGWPTTSLELSVMFFVVTLILAVQAEYIGRILSESRRESDYFVIEELESDTLIAETERRNVAAA